MRPPAPEGPPGAPPPGYQMMYLMPDGRMMPAHGIPPAVMTNYSYAPYGGPPRPPTHAPGWGPPPPTWGGAPGQPWGARHSPHQQHFHPYSGVPPPRPPPLGAHQPTPPQRAPPAPLPPGSTARVPPTPNSSAVGGGTVLAPGTRAGSIDVARPAMGTTGAMKSTSVPSAPAPGAALASSSGVAASDSAPKSGKTKKAEKRTGNKQDKGVTFPTVDEIPVVAPVDVASLPEDVRAYREERAKNWPGRAREEARDESEKNAAAAEAEAAERAARRRARLAEVLAEQRRLGHFEASEAMGEITGGPGKIGRPGDPGDATDRPGDRRKGRGAKAGGRGGGAPREPKPAPRRGERDWTGGAARPSPFEAGPVPDAKRRRVDGDEDVPGDVPGDVSRRPREKTRACRFWNAGVCRRGDACGFRHDGEPGTPPDAPGPYASPVDTEGIFTGNGTDSGAARAPPGGAGASAPVPGDVSSAAPVPRDVPGDAARAAAPPCRHYARGRCAAGASCAFSHAGGQTAVRQNDRAHARQKPIRRSAPLSPSRQTLLKKLFAKEVRVDNARLLQVFRFLVANDFLRHDKRLDALWVFPWADDPERDPERDTKERLRKLAAEAQQAQDAEDE